MTKAEKAKRYAEKQRRAAARRQQPIVPKGRNRKDKIRSRKIKPRWGGKPHDFDMKITLPGITLQKVVRAGNPIEAARLGLHENRSFIIDLIGLDGRSKVEITHKFRGVVLEREMRLPCAIIFAPRLGPIGGRGQMDKRSESYLGLALSRARRKIAMGREREDARQDIEKFKVEGGIDAPSFPGRERVAE